MASKLELRDLVRKRMAEEGLSFSAVGRLSGTSTSTAHRLACGILPSRRKLLAMADVLGIPHAEILKLARTVAANRAMAPWLD